MLKSIRHPWPLPTSHPSVMVIVPNFIVSTYSPGRGTLPSRACPLQGAKRGWLSPGVTMGKSAWPQAREFGVGSAQGLPRCASHPSAALSRPSAEVLQICLLLQQGCQAFSGDPAEQSHIVHHTFLFNCAVIPLIQVGWQEHVARLPVRY